MSQGILKLVHLARDAGLHSEDGQWSKAFVYWFDNFMPDEVRAAGNADASLDYIDSDGTPHNPAGEGFIDRETNTAISFLLETKI